MPSTNDAEVMAIKPTRDGSRYLKKVGTMAPSRAWLSLMASLVINYSNLWRYYYKHPIRPPPAEEADRLTQLDSINISPSLKQPTFPIMRSKSPKIGDVRFWEGASVKTISTRPLQPGLLLGAATGVDHPDFAIT